MSNIKYYIKHFDGKNNFSTWQSTDEDVLVQGVHLKAL